MFVVSFYYFALSRCVFSQVEMCVCVFFFFSSSLKPDFRGNKGIARWHTKKKSTGSSEMWESSFKVDDEHKIELNIEWVRAQCHKTDWILCSWTATQHTQYECQPAEMNTRWTRNVRWKRKKGDERNSNRLWKEIKDQTAKTRHTLIHNICACGQEMVNASARCCERASDQCDDDDFASISSRPFNRSEQIKPTIFIDYQRYFSHSFARSLSLSLSVAIGHCDRAQAFISFIWISQLTINLLSTTHSFR